MSFFGSNPSRADQKGTSETEERTQRSSDTTFLGEVNLLSNRPESPPRPFTGERVSAATAAQGGPTPPEKCNNVVAVGAKWQGTLTVEDSVRVDGIFSGELQAKGTVHVADGAQVDAKIRAAYVVISGNFRGEVRCEQKTELLPRSRVSGEIMTRILSIQEGAILDGRVQMTGGAEGERERPGRQPRAASGESDVQERRQDRAAAAINSGNNNRPTDD
jgi:cytoskeletal protein CcmA (bactofilin family)